MIRMVFGTCFLIAWLVCSLLIVVDLWDTGTVQEWLPLPFFLFGLPGLILVIYGWSAWKKRPRGRKRPFLPTTDSGRSTGPMQTVEVTCGISTEYRDLGIGVGYEAKHTYAKYETQVNLSSYNSTSFVCPVCRMALRLTIIPPIPLRNAFSVGFDAVSKGFIKPFGLFYWPGAVNRCGQLTVEVDERIHGKHVICRGWRNITGDVFFHYTRERKEYYERKHKEIE